jgi:hypothetical protein
MTEAEAAPAIPKPLFAYRLLYGGMTCIAGCSARSRSRSGPLAVEAGIFAFLLLGRASSAVAQLYGRPTSNRLVRFRVHPLVTAIVLSWIVL